jgi:hypothetical protein
MVFLQCSASLKKTYFGRKTIFRQKSPCDVDRNMDRRLLNRLKGYRFEILVYRHHLGWIDAHTISEILKSLEKTQALKKKLNFL